MNLTEYREHSASVSEIENHLNKCNSLFTPHLNSYVNIQDYAGKINKNAVTFEAWCGNELAGLVACYLNNKETLLGHITNISVLKEHQHKGIAKNLLEQTINKAKINGFKTLTLEVSVENKNAIQLYQNSGFILSQRVGNKYSMLKRLNENTDVMVSICCVTYNHENFIRDAIDGFLMQKTNFPIEILIHDDASTDNTPEILREYEAKHPDIIKPIYQTENQYQQGRTISSVYQWPRARGKYIAMCEGDDYWTDPLKLQKQVDFLEANEEYSICFHPVKINKKGTLIDDYITREVPETTDIFEMAKGNYIHTPSVVFRKNWETLPEWFSKCTAGDYALHMINAQYGKIKKLDDIMGVYRIHDTNMWVSQDPQDMAVKIHAYLDAMIDNFTEEVNLLLKKRYLDITLNLAKSYFNAGDQEKAILYFQKLVQKHPEPIIKEYIEATKPKTASYLLHTLIQKAVIKFKNIFK